MIISWKLLQTHKMSLFLLHKIKFIFTTSLGIIVTTYNLRMWCFCFSMSNVDKGEYSTLSIVLCKIVVLRYILRVTYRTDIHADRETWLPKYHLDVYAHMWLNCKKPVLLKKGPHASRLLWETWFSCLLSLKSLIYFH